MKRMGALAACLAVFMSPTVNAHQQTLSFTAGAIAIPHAEVTDQRGTTGRLDQMLAGKRFVLTFQFADCKTLCPATNLVMAELDRLVIEHGVEDALLFSVTLAPEEDTPERLAAQADDLGASPQWRWLTGAPDQMADVNRAFGVKPGDKEQHDLFFIVGSADAGTFQRISGLPTPQQLYDALEKLPR